MIKYWLKVWFLVSAYLICAHSGTLLFNLFMDWVVTFSHQQILGVIFVFTSVVTASVMVFLRWTGMIS